MQISHYLWLRYNFYSLIHAPRNSLIIFGRLVRKKFFGPKILPSPIGLQEEWKPGREPLWRSCGEPIGGEGRPQIFWD